MAALAEALQALDSISDRGVQLSDDERHFYESASEVYQARYFEIEAEHAS